MPDIDLDALADKIAARLQPDRTPTRSEVLASIAAKTAQLPAVDRDGNLIKEGK